MCLYIPIGNNNRSAKLLIKHLIHRISEVKIENQNSFKPISNAFLSMHFPSTYTHRRNDHLSALLTGCNWKFLRKSPGGYYTHIYTRQHSSFYLSSLRTKNLSLLPSVITESSPDPKERQQTTSTCTDIQKEKLARGMARSSATLLLSREI